MEECRYRHRLRRDRSGLVSRFPVTEASQNEMDVLKAENRKSGIWELVVEKWQEIAEKLYQQLLVRDNAMEE